MEHGEGGEDEGDSGDEPEDTEGLNAGGLLDAEFGKKPGLAEIGREPGHPRRVGGAANGFEACGGLSADDEAVKEEQDSKQDSHFSSFQGKSIKPMIWLLLPRAQRTAPLQNQNRLRRLTLQQMVDLFADGLQI